MQFKPRLLLFLLLLFAGTGAWAQVCTGTLGDPVFTQDFGSPTRTAEPIVTGYNYTTSTCPNDGSYTIANSTSACFGNAWHTVTHDHTGDPGGYMMIVNADEVAGKEFFKQTTTAGALCGNTTYEFSAYVMNLISPNGSHIKPNLSFIIESLDGTVLKNYPTGDIPESAGSDGWVKYGTLFETSAGVTQVVIRIVNNAPGGNGNDLLLDDINFRACGPFVQVGFSGDVTVTQKSVCVGSPATYHLTTPQITANNDPRYQWQQNLNDGAGWTDIPGAINSFYDPVIPANTPVSSRQYKIGLAEGENITSPKCRAYSNAVTINITAYPITPAPLNLAFCEGGTLSLPATGGATYKWSGPGINGVTQNPLVINNVKTENAGHYTVEIISEANCSSFGDVYVTVNPKPVIATNQPAPICKGDGTQLTASVTNADPNATYTYSWLPATGLSDAHLPAPMATPNTSTPYIVTVTNNLTGCVDTRQVQVDVLELPVANAGADKKIFEGQTVTLDGSATGDVTYSWSPTEYLDDPTSPTPKANPPHNMPYHLTVTSAHGCGENTDDMFVRVFEKIVIPSTFTPNNDGTNDIWNIEALETYPDGVITVFTRSGKQVFQSKVYGKAWDGKFNGSPLPAGTYYYVIDLKNDTPKMSGWVLLVR